MLVELLLLVGRETQIGVKLRTRLGIAKGAAKAVGLG